MKIYLFNGCGIQLLVKAPNEFMAACYANQWLQTRYIFKFETNDAIEVDNDMSFGVVVSISEGSVEMYDSEKTYYQNIGNDLVKKSAILEK